MHPIYLIFAFVTLAHITSNHDVEEVNLSKPATRTNSNLQKRMQRQLNWLNANESFVFDVICGPIPRQNCTDAKMVLAMAGLRIAETILLKIPIRIQVEFQPRLRESLISTGELAAAMIPKQYLANKPKSPFKAYYPQALVKQKVAAGPTADTTPYDIIITIDSNRAWYFGTDGISIPKDKFDLQCN